ncbi:FxLYD domain-containing protein [Sediminibacterium soli]|uniref:FxLYD domain-containing protein n=1 Tax=Sediminibacterium soli TaxID=2698829 RepID=UPI00137A11A1|nr:FxLYD domain-containing protein [Sediminibacterium soli]NCI47515.1 hypothetical protein [Sediminibacterium soli]
MKKGLLAAALFAVAFGCKNGKKEKEFDTKSYEQVKESLAEKEKNSPAKFLFVESRDRKNLIGQTVVKGTLTNRATVCWYKDVEIHLSFYSKTGVKLDEGLETVYENIAPGKTVRFKTKYFAPKGTDSVAVQVTKAKGDISIPK